MLRCRCSVQPLSGNGHRLARIQVRFRSLAGWSLSETIRRSCQELRRGLAQDEELALLVQFEGLLVRQNALVRVLLLFPVAFGDLIGRQHEEFAAVNGDHLARQSDQALDVQHGLRGCGPVQGRPET